MKLAGDYILDAPRELVWRALLDPNVLSKTLPGCEDLREVGENQYEGRLKMKVGPVQGVFEGEVQLSNIDAPNSYDLTIEGKGAPGFMNGNGTLTLADDPGGTKLTYEIDAQVGGRIASVGQRLVESSAKVITKQGLKGLDQQIRGLKESEPVAEESVTETAVEASPSETETPEPATASATPEPVEPVAALAATPAGEGANRVAPLLLGLALLAIAAFFIIQRGCA
ncbi:MAG: carbon monoxide dehydrogenase subunit G [Acidobacteriota bacterium]